MRAAAAALAVAVLAVVPAHARGAAGQALDALSGMRRAGTGVPSTPGDTPQRVHAIAAWTALAVAGAGEDPRAWRLGARTVAAAVGPMPTGSPLGLGRWLVAAHAARLLTAADQQAAVAALAPIGTVGQGDGLGDLDRAWVALGLAAAGGPAPGPMLDALRADQTAEGGWPSAPGNASDTAATAAVVQALVAWDTPADDARLRAARAWLQAAQGPDGGFPVVPGGPTSTVETAWATLALRALGERPTDPVWRRGGGPLGLLGARQRPDGALAETAGGPADAFATALAVLAFSGAALPVAPAAPGAVRDRAPVVTRLRPSDGGAPGLVVTATFHDDPGGTGVDPRTTRLRANGVDVTARAVVTRFGLTIPTASLGRLPRHLVLRLTDRAGNIRRVGWTVG